MHAYNVSHDKALFQAIWVCILAHTIFPLYLNQWISRSTLKQGKKERIRCTCPVGRSSSKVYQIERFRSLTLNNLLNLFSYLSLNFEGQWLTVAWLGTRGDKLESLCNFIAIHIHTTFRHKAHSPLGDSWGIHGQKVPIGFLWNKLVVSDSGITLK